MTLSLAALALALAMDAFAVAVAQGACERPRLSDALEIGAAFGAAQAIMPLLGWLLGLAFYEIISPLGHWVAAFVLAFLGIRMIHAAMTAQGGAKVRLSGWGIAAAAVATSLDALAVGITLPALGLPVLLSCAVIGLATALLSFAGVYLGRAANDRLGAWADVLGGSMLIGLGGKIFIEQQFFGS